MLFHTSLNALSPSAVNGSGSAIAAVFCTRRLFHTPDRSARPSACHRACSRLLLRRDPASTREVRERAAARGESRAPRRRYLRDWLAASLEDPARTTRPSPSFHVRALHVLVPFLACQPSTMMSSPSVKVLRVHPCRVNALGAPPSHCHGVSFPSFSRTSR